MRILFTTPVLEHPAAGGPQLRIENSIKALSGVCEVDIIYRASGSIEAIEETNNFFRNFTAEYHVLSRQNRSGVINSCISFAEKLFNYFFDTRATKQARYIIDHIDRRKIDIVWFGYGNISYPLIRYIKARRPGLKVVCDTDSVWSRYILREFSYASVLRKLPIWYSGKKKEAEERAWVNLCEVTTAVSEVDAEYYRNIANDPGRVHLFSNVIDIQTYIQPPLPPINFKSPSIYLAGSFFHHNSPMNSAARWVLNDVFPRIIETHPNVHFYIVGRGSELSFGHLNSQNITVTGRLETVLPYLCNTNVALVPLKFESGTRFKILEAGACKIPLVSTTLGAEGIPVRDNEHILIADEAEDFAAAIIRLLDDTSLANRLAQNCHNLVNERYSIQSLMNEAKQIMEYLNHD